MSEDWQAGDLALCVNNTPDSSEPLSTRLTVGGVYTVSVVGHRTMDGAFSLGFASVPSINAGSVYGFRPWRFRKIRPHTPDAEDDETIRLLAGKPVREAGK